MSTKNLYSIRDLVAEEFAPPFVSNNDNTAIRASIQSVTENKIMMAHISDYSLFNLGSFDENTGEIVPNSLHSTPIFMFSELEKKESDV